MDVKQILDMLDPSAIQRLLDDQLDRTGALRFVDWVRYVPQGQPPPEGWTHLLTLSSASGQRIDVAVKGKVPYTLLVDALLAIL